MQCWPVSPKIKCDDVPEINPFVHVCARFLAFLGAERYSAFLGKFNRLWPHGTAFGSFDDAILQIIAISEVRVFHFPKLTNFGRFKRT